MSEEYDWSALAQPGVLDLIERVARSVAIETGMEEDDLFQTGTLIVSRTTCDLHGLAFDPSNYGLLAHGLHRDLQNATRTDRRRADLNSPLPEQGSQQEDDYYEVVINFDCAPEGYTEGVLMAALPALWDESYLLRLDQNKHAAGGDMPRGTGGKVKSNTHWALIADVRRAWEEAPLNEQEKQCILLAVGLDYSLREIAGVTGITKSTADRRIRTGLHAMCEFLNGVEVTNG